MGQQQTYLACAVLAFAWTAQTAKQCYHPDETPGDWTVCDETKEHSACCAPDDACLSNGYCFQQTNAPDLYNLRISRGLCTDKSWESLDCPQFCREINGDGTAELFLVDHGTQGRWCCSGYNAANDTCNIPTKESREPFTLVPGQVIYNRKTGDTLGASTTFDDNATATTTVTAKADNNNNVAIGAGVGVPMGLLLLAAVTALVLLMMKLKNLKMQHWESQQHLQLLPQDNKAPYSYPMHSEPTGANYGLWNPPAPQEAPAENSRAELGTEPDAREAPTSPATRS